MQSIASLLMNAPCVGFSGSRSPIPASQAALLDVAAQVPRGAVVVVGCARGIDQATRAIFPTAHVFYASDFGKGRGAFAARSIACVRSVAASGGVWVSFPSAGCPVGLLPSAKPSQCFSGTGSGTWASLAFAVGSGVSCLVFLPEGVTAPVGWGWQSLGQGWFSIVPTAFQASLF